MKRNTILLLIAVLWTLAWPDAQAATIPQLASGVGRELDRQVVQQLGLGESPAGGVSIIATTPVNINDLSESSPLARQMQEEISRWFVQAGYEIKEVRKGAGLLFHPETGELLLTRNSELLQSSAPSSTLTMAGTYIVTPQHVRFNIRLIQTNSLSVVAMSSVTIPITDEIISLLHDQGANANRALGIPIAPSVVTTLP